jgi:F-type H+-transporting ATPase subunit gamma
MLATVLNSDIAVKASVRVVRAFIRLREMVATNAHLAAKLEELEGRLGSHDKAIADLFAALKRLLAPPEPPKRREIGFHPLLAVRPLEKELVLIISTDKGLCGALNTNLFREASNFDSTNTAFVVSGKKARQFIARTKRELLADFELKDSPSFIEAKPISKFCMEKFLRREVDKVSVLYTHFINTINQRTVVQTLLPISSFDLPKGEAAQAESEGHDPMIGYVFEPNAEGVLDSMLPYYVSYQVFQMILDARASEHSARMVAMKNATDNANQFIKDLTLEYNKMRQASITTELLEIATAQMALSG